ncbi:MAG TPA: acyl-CoA dehydrogenase family protein [Solirubrobacteraceae bacterium]
MRFAPSSEQREFAASLRELLAKADVPAAVRSGDWRRIWPKLAEAGVTALNAPDSLGGFGGDAVDLVVAFIELGRAAVPGPVVESVAVLPALLAGTPDEDVVAQLAAGEVVATLALPPLVPFLVAGTTVDRCYVLDGTVLHTAAAGTEQRSVDASRRLAEIVPKDSLADGVDAQSVIDVGALATAAQLIGLGEALLERGTAYALQRVQFGRPIGSFQAVKHQLADAAVGLELARPLLFGAALALRDRSATRARDVSAAKVAAGEAAYRASRASLQVHGAIGYTAEYDLAIWLTKVRALLPAWGTPAWHRARVLAALQEQR